MWRTALPGTDDSSSGPEGQPIPVAIADTMPSYKRNDDMSVYHVDAMSERVHMEQDIGNRIHESLENHRPPAPPTSYSTRKQVPSAFPEARPHQGSSLRRDVSSASAYGGAEPTVVPSSFPVPAPAPYNPEQVAAYKEYTQNEQRP